MTSLNGDGWKMVYLMSDYMKMEKGVLDTFGRPPENYHIEAIAAALVERQNLIGSAVFAVIMAKIYENDRRLLMRDLFRLAQGIESEEEIDRQEVLRVILWCLLPYLDDDVSVLLDYCDSILVAG